MLFLTTTQSLEKVELLKLLMCSDSVISENEIIEKLKYSANKLKRISANLNADLGYTYLEKKNALYFINREHRISLFEYYYSQCSKDIAYKILKKLLFENKLYTLESLAMELYVSKSTIYVTIEKINAQFEKFDIKIKVKKGIFLFAEKSALFNLIFEMQHIQPNKLQESSYLLNIETKKILSSFNIKTEFFTVEIFSKWLDTFLVFRKIKNRKSIHFINREKLPIEILQSYYKFTDLIKKLSNISIFDSEDREDCYLLYLGLFTSNIKFESYQHMTSFNILHFSQKDNTFKQTISDFIVELTDYFPYERHVLFSHAIKAIFSNFSFFKLQYLFHLTSHCLTKCPLETSNIIKTLPSLKKMKFAPEDQCILIEMIWIVCQKFEKEVPTYLGSKKFVFHSSMGDQARDIIKSKLINSFFEDVETTNQQNSCEILHIVDDYRLTNNENTIHINCLLRNLSNIGNTF